MHTASPWEFIEFDTWDFFINSQLHLVVFVLNRFLAALRETLHQQLFIWTLYLEIASEGRINTNVLDRIPIKATNSADIVASEIWLSATVA